MSKIIFTEEGTTPSNPSSGQVSLYAKTDGVVYVLSYLGVETAIGTTNGITSLSGDVIGTGPGSAVTTVAYVGGQAAATIAASVVEVGAATSASVASTIVKRDSSNNFAANVITATLNGNAATATAAISAIGFTGPLAGDVIGNQSTTSVAYVGGSSAANIHSAELAANAATPINLAGTIVLRDASGNFAANVVTAALVGNVTGNVTGNVSGSSASFTGSLVGDVTGLQGSTSVVAIRGTGVSGTAPTDAQILVYNSGTGNWTPVSLSSDGSITHTGALTLSTTAVTAKLLTGYAVGSNTAITASDSILSALEKLQGQLNSTVGAAITQLTGDITAVGPGSVSSTVAKIQGTTVSGTTGSGSVVFSAAPTLTGLLSGASAIFSSTISASNLSGTNTGDVTLTSTNSIALSFSSGQSGLSANLNLSAASPDSGYIPVYLQVKTDGLLAEVLTGTPVQIGTTNSPGSANSTVHSDHVHAHGAQTDPTLHAVATDSANGFMSAADKTKLDAATSYDYASTIVFRDPLGNFGAGTITANLVGNVTGNVSGSSASFTGSLSGDVSGTQSATVVGAIQGKTVSSTAPTDAQLLVWNNSTSKWVPVNIGSDATMADSGALTVVALQGQAVSNIAPTDAQVLVWNNSTSKWTPVSLSSDVNITDAGAATIQANVVSNSKLAQMPADTLKGNNTGSPANAADLTVSQVNAMLGTVTVVGTIDSQSPSANGLVISGNDIYAQSASASNPGMVNNTTQTFSGNKTLTGQMSIANTSTTALTVNTTSLVVDATNSALGIGTAPATNVVLDLVNNSGTTKAVQATGYGSNVGFRGRHANGTLSSPTATASGNTMSFFSARGYGATGFGTSSTGDISIVAAENFTDSSMATYISFSTTPTGSVSSSERLRINSTGNILIGTTSDNGSDLLQLAGGLSGKYAKLVGSTSGYLELIVPSVVTTYTLTLPSAVAASNSALVSSSSGTGSWLAYGSANVNSTLVERDSTGSFAATNLLNGSNNPFLQLVARQFIDNNGNILLDLDNDTPSGAVVPQSTVIAQLGVTSSNNTAQFVIQNFATGGPTSSDYIANSDQGTNTNYFADFGINASTFSDPTWTINGAGDAYLYNNDGGLAIGANISGLTASPLKFFMGGSLAANLVAQFNNSGVFQLGSQAGSSPVQMQFVNANTGTLQWNPSSSVTYTLPPTQGAGGTYLANDGSGNLSWTNPVTGIDGGNSSSNYVSSQIISGGNA